MSMHRPARLMSAGLLVSVALAGCARDETVEPQRGPPQVFSFTNVAGTAVSQQDIVGKSGTEPVTADFNLDGLDDFAIIQHASDKLEEVGIYIRQPGAPQSSPDQSTYYRGGAIRVDAGNRITGIASCKDKVYTDLILLISQTGKSPVMIHYRNDGSGFTEVD